MNAFFKVIFVLLIIVPGIAIGQDVKEILYDNSPGDLNTLKPGQSSTSNVFFYRTSPGWANKPASSYVNYGFVTGYDQNSFSQFAFASGDDNMYFRTYAFGYGNWNKMWHSGNFDPGSYIQKNTPVLQLNAGNSIYSDANNLALFTEGGYVFSNSNNTVTRAVLSSAGALSLYNPTTVSLYLNPVGNSFFNSGNVGIGTTNPTQKLSVDGTILAKKVKVSQASADWPDYVFDSSYQLPSLDSVSSFIQLNKHLPDMPSAVVVEKDGHDLGEVQKLLLKKMEEMTLYMIELKKENKILANKVDSQQAEIELLKENKK
ncbi:MAG: hypothetical protein J0I41_24305 [Filimonas sp.]|nr:hypothetical protein [Filimonas sp.]